MSTLGFIPFILDTVRTVAVEADAESVPVNKESSRGPIEYLVAVELELELEPEPEPEPEVCGVFVHVEISPL